MAQAHIFAVESQSETLIITPNRNIGNLSETPVQAEWQEILNRIAAGNVRHVVFDLKFVRYLGSSMIEAMLLIWKRLRRRRGRLAVCNASQIASEILELSNLPAIWSICESRDQALAAVQSDG